VKLVLGASRMVLTPAFPVVSLVLLGSLKVLVVEASIP